MVHKVTLICLATALVLTVPACSDDPVSSETDPNALDTVTPEEVGFSSAALQEAVAGFEAKWLRRGRGALR